MLVGVPVPVALGVAVRVAVEGGVAVSVNVAIGPFVDVAVGELNGVSVGVFVGSAVGTAVKVAGGGVAVGIALAVAVFAGAAWLSFPPQAQSESWRRTLTAVSPQEVPDRPDLNMSLQPPSSRPVPRAVVQFLAARRYQPCRLRSILIGRKSHKICEPASQVEGEISKPMTERDQYRLNHAPSWCGRSSYAPAPMPTRSS